MRPAQLGADRAARAGDHDDAVAEPLGEPRAVEHHRVAAQQVVQLDRADRRQRRAAADQVLVGRHRQHLDPGVGADLRDAPAHAVRGRRGARTITCRTPYFVGPGREARDRPEHAHVVQQPPAASPGRRRSARRRAIAGSARLRVSRARAAPAPTTSTGSPSAAKRAVQLVLLPDPVREAIAGHQEDEHDRVEDQHAARHDGLQLQHHQHAAGSAARRGRRRATMRRRSTNAREPPQAAVEAERDEDRALQRQDPRPASHTMSARNGSLDVQAEAQPVTSPPRRARRRQGRGQNASQARKLRGRPSLVPARACANDNQCRRRECRSRAAQAPSTHQPAARCGRERERVPKSTCRRSATP